MPLHIKLACIAQEHRHIGDGGGNAVVYGALKKELNQSLDTAVDAKELGNRDMFDFCNMLRVAFYKALTKNIIISVFKRARIGPYVQSRLLSKPKPDSENNVTHVLSQMELVAMLGDKLQWEQFSVLSEDAQLLQAGFIDTRKGMVLTWEIKWRYFWKRRMQTLRSGACRRSMQLYESSLRWEGNQKHIKSFGDWSGRRVLR